MFLQDNKGMENCRNYKLYNISTTSTKCSIAWHVMQQNLQKYLLYLAVLSLFRLLVCSCIQQMQYKNLSKQAQFCIMPFWIVKYAHLLSARVVVLFFAQWCSFAWFSQLPVFQDSFISLEIKNFSFLLLRPWDNFVAFIFPNAIINGFHHQNPGNPKLQKTSTVGVFECANGS